MRRGKDRSDSASSRGYGGRSGAFSPPRLGCPNENPFLDPPVTTSRRRCCMGARCCALLRRRHRGSRLCHVLVAELKILSPWGFFSRKHRRPNKKIEMDKITILFRFKEVRLFIAILLISAAMGTFLIRTQDRSLKERIIESRSTKSNAVSASKSTK